MIQRLVGRRKEREVQVRQTFDSVVTALANGEQVDEAEIDALLEAVGKEPDELQAAVERLVQRREAVAKLAEANAMRLEEKDFTDKAQKLSADLTEFRQRVAPEIAAAAKRADEIRNDANQLEGWAKRILESTAPAGIAERQTAIHERRILLARKQSKRRDEMQEGSWPLSIAGRALRERTRLDNMLCRGITAGQEFQSASLAAAESKQWLDEAKAELAGVNVQLAELDAESAAIEAEKYQVA